MPSRPGVVMGSIYLIVASTSSLEKGLISWAFISSTTEGWTVSRISLKSYGRVEENREL